MKKLQVRTRYKNNNPSYKSNLDHVITFLRHDQDKIVVKNQEVVEIEIYDNGELIFIGDKHEFYKTLKNGSKEIL